MRRPRQAQHSPRPGPFARQPGTCQPVGSGGRRRWPPSRKRSPSAADPDRWSLPARAWLPSCPPLTRSLGSVWPVQA